eukprot:1498887-Rhodomonas_salina.2
MRGRMNRRGGGGRQEGGGQAINHMAHLRQGWNGVVCHSLVDQFLECRVAAPSVEASRVSVRHRNCVVIE